MLTLHGTLDALLPIRDTTSYVEKVRAAGKGDMHRYYVVDQGTHVDSLAADFPDRLRPILPVLPRRVPRDGALGRARRGAAADADDRAAGRGRRGQRVHDPGRRRRRSSPRRSAYSPPPGAAAGLRAAGAQRPGARRAGCRCGSRRGATAAARTASARRGRLLLPSFVTPDYGCGEGVVSVQIKARGRTVSTRRARLRNDCTFRSARHASARGAGCGRGRLRVIARFEGNSTLAPVSARPRRVRAV